MNERIPGTLLAAVLAMGHAGMVRATEVQIANAMVQRTTVSANTSSGGCTALLGKQLSSFGLNCVGRLVTFGCDGVLVTKDLAWRMFDSAQLAAVRKLAVNITVTDEHKAPDNATCFASRVEVVSPK